MDLAKALAYVGHHAFATVGGFIVDIAGVADAGSCQCCDLVVFDLHDPDPEALALYRGRRIVVPQGPMWTT